MVARGAEEKLEDPVSLEANGRAMNLPDSARQFLTSGRLAHLVTINPDGSPQLSCVWTEVADDEILVAHLGEGQKIRNMQRDPRVVLSVEGSGHNPGGLTEYLVVHGDASLVPGGAPELLERLAVRYKGPDVEFPPPQIRRPGNVIHIRPRRLGGIGPWAG